MSSVRRSAQCPTDGRHFFFSIELSYLRVRRKRRLGGPRGFREQLSQKSLASRIFIVQNGPAWSWVRRPATALNRAEFGQLSR